LWLSFAFNLDLLLLGLHFIVILRCLAARATTTTGQQRPQKTTIIDNNNGNNNTRMPRAYLCLPCGMWSAARDPRDPRSRCPHTQAGIPLHSPSFSLAQKTDPHPRSCNAQVEFSASALPVKLQNTFAATAEVFRLGLGDPKGVSHREKVQRASKKI